MTRVKDRTHTHRYAVSAARPGWVCCEFCAFAVPRDQLLISLRAGADCTQGAFREMSESDQERARRENLPIPSTLRQNRGGVA